MHLDLPWLEGCGLGDAELEHATGEARLDVVCVDATGQGEGAVKA
jgi:hypothetical protein